MSGFQYCLIKLAMSRCGCKSESGVEVCEFEDAYIFFPNTPNSSASDIMAKTWTKQNGIRVASWMVNINFVPSPSYRNRLMAIGENSIKIQNATRSDTGTYTLVLTSGSTQTFIESTSHLKVLVPPTIQCTPNITQEGDTLVAILPPDVCGIPSLAPSWMSGIHTLTNIHFQGQCILYSEIEWTNTTHFILHPSKDINCSFPIYLSVFVCIFYGLAMGIYNGYALYKSNKDPTIGSQMWVMPFIMLNTLVALVILVSSCMVSVGFSSFCNGLQKYGASCSSFENVHWRNLKDNTFFEPESYFKFLTVAQVASWTSFLIWLCLVALGILRLVRNRRQRSQNMNISDKDTKPIATVEPVD